MGPIIGLSSACVVKALEVPRFLGGVLLLTVLAAWFGRQTDETLSETVYLLIGSVASFGGVVALGWLTVLLFKSHEGFGTCHSEARLRESGWISSLAAGSQ